MKILQCPHLASISGLIRYCMDGRFPANCETCDCKDKYYVDCKVTTDSISLNEDNVESAMILRYYENNPTYIYGINGKGDKTMDYEKIKLHLLAIQDMMKEIPQDCKGNSEDANVNRRKYTKVKSMVNDLIEIL